MRSLFAVLLVPVLCAGLLTGCAGETLPVQSQDTGTVVVAMDPASEPAAGFDPAYGWGAGEHVHEPLIQSTLTVTTAELGISYDLATGMNVSEDGLVWTVRIREDAHFTDGQRLTAKDVAFTYNMVKELSTVSDFTMLEHARALDDNTVVFQMRTPYSIWPYSMAHVGIIPAHAYSAQYGQNPIGSGRYILRQWDKGQQVILEANPDYYGPAPKIQKVVILFMGEDAAFTAARAGQVDVAYTAAPFAAQQVNGYHLLSVETVDNRGINLPAIPPEGGKGNALTSDPAVRQAINKGIDREALIDRLLDGYGTPAYSVCDRMPWFWAGNAVAYDPEGAKTLLDQAGWRAGMDGVREKDGVRAALNILYPVGDSVRQAVAAEVANQLTALGISSSFEGVGWDTAYDRAQSEPLVWGWGAHTPMEMYNIYHTAPDSTLATYSPYANSAVDRLMEQALASLGPEEGLPLWQQAQEQIAQDLPWVWLLNVNHLYWVRDGLAVSAQKLHPHGHGWSIVNNVDQWSYET